ncbi:hypothetical protein, partial [Methylobacterium sp. WL64]|uniref:hypothetical protein n=1 Tax=Methylobacterium sp. WL64 TaxID=2603894 RepID=UPI001AED9EF4
IRTLQPQHQFDQLLAAQPLKIGTNHPTRESAKPNPRKGVGNYTITLLGQYREDYPTVGTTGFLSCPTNE